MKADVLDEWNWMNEQECITGDFITATTDSILSALMEMSYNHENAKKYDDPSEVDKVIANQLNQYEKWDDNPAVLTTKEAEALLKTDLDKYRKKAINLAKKTGLTFSQNEMDAITSIVYNTGGKGPDDPDTLLYYFLRKDKEGAMNVLRKAVEKDWYEDKPGVFRRRLMEYNIFFNNDYTFYDSNEVEKLKKVVGYYKKEK